MDWLKKALGSIGSFFGGAVNQGVKTAERYVPGVRQAEQVVNRVAPQIQRPKLQLPQVPKINVDSVLRSFAKSQLNPQQYNQLIQSKDPLVGIGMGIQKVATPTNLARAAAFNPATTPIVMAGAKMGGPTTQESMQKIGSFAANAPIIKQGRQIINAAPIDPFGHKGESVVKFVNEGLVQPTLKQIGRFNDVTTGRSNYDEGLKGLAQYGSDALTIGSLAYTGGKALQLNKATTMAAAKKLAPGVAARQFGSGAAQNAVYQVAEGKKIKEISPLEVLLSGAAYAGLGTGLPLVNKLLHPAPKVVNNAITRKADDAYRKYTSKLIDDQANKFQAGKINEQQFRGFVIDDFQQRYGRNPSEADIQALMARPSAGLRSRGEQIIQQVRAGADPTNFRTQATAPTFPEAGRLRAEGINARVSNQTPGLPVRPQNAVADTAPQLPAHLQKAGYKLDPNDGMLYDKAGRQIDPGHAQMILEEPGLMQQEQAFARGDRATVAKIAKEHPGDARYQLLQQEKSVEKTLTAPVADTAPIPNKGKELSFDNPEEANFVKQYASTTKPKMAGEKKVGNQLESQIGKQYEAKGSVVDYVGFRKGMQDHGIDLTAANKDGSVDLIQAKVRGLEGSNKTLHERPVQAFYAASEEARKQFNRPVNRVIITTAKNVDDDAIKFANTHGITIITQNIDGTGQRVITKAAKDVVLPPATVKLSAEESRRIQNVIPVGRRAEFLSDLENPNSGISRAMGSVPPEKRLSMAEDWYKAVDPEGTYQLTSLKGMAHNLAQARDVAAVKRVIADDIVNNKQLEGFNPLDLPLMKRLEQDPKFAQKVADATNESELRAVLNQVGGGGIYDPLLSNNAKLNKVLAETDLTTGQGFQPGQAKYAQASLPQTAQSSQTLPPEFRATIQRMDYQVVPNDETLAKAALQMAENPSKMQEEVLNLTLRRGLSKMHLGSGRLPDTDEVAKAMLVVDKLSREGDYTTANQVLEHLTKQSTELGRAVQLFSIYNKTTPEGIGKYAHSLIKQYNDKVRVGKQVKDVTDEQLQRFTERARALQDMPEGRPRDIQTAKLMRDVEGLIPASWQEKAAMYLYLSQLLFPKTAIRNIVGNTFMLAAEDISHLVGAPIDAVATMITKKPRTIYTPHILRQMGDLGRGFKMGVQEAVQGIDLRNIASGKYDVKPFVFKSKAGQVAEKALAIELTAFDRAFYEAARNNVIRDMTHGLAKSKGIPVGKVKPTQEILDAADAFGRYMTYQDDSALAKLATDMKHGLNKVTTGSDAFGLGSAVLNYPKTPSNLVLRGLDYSPAGFVRVFADIIKPMMMRGEKFNRTKFINDLTRATTGTVNLTVFGGVLQAVGIVTPGNKDSSKDVKAFEKSIGSGNYKFNVDGFKRFVFGGFNPDLAKPQQNDQLISYDWAQPLAIPFTAGAEIAQQMSSKKQSAKKRVASLGNVGAQIAEGAQTLTEQPLLQGMQKLFGSQNGINGGLALLQGVPASFVPSALRGARNLADNVSRETYSPDWTQGAKNQVINSIPGLSKILPARYTPLGDVTENYQNGTNNLFNVAFNPAFVSKYQTDEVQSEIQRLFGQTGSASVVPNLANNDYTINGQNYTLSGEQKSKFQEVMGKTANNLLGQLFNTSYYNNANDVNKQKMIQNVITDATSLAKETVVASADKTDSSVQRILSGGMPNYRPGGGNDPRSRYETALASYQDKVKNNEISEVGKIQQERSLNALKVKADFDADTVDLYSMSNKEIDAYIKSKQNGGDIFNKLLALDDSMVKAGYTSKFRDKYGRLRNLAGSSGSRKGRKVARAAIPKLRMPKIGRLPSGKLKVALKTKKPRALA